MSDSTGTTRYSSSVAEDQPTATEFRDEMGAVMSRCLDCFSYNNFLSALPNTDKRLLKEKHEEMITALRDYMMEELLEICDDTDVITSLNDLYKFTKSQPFTFEKVWRPSESAADDIEAHLAQAHFKFKTLVTQILNDLRRKNEEEKAEIKRTEEEIQAITKELAALAYKSKAAELTTANQLKLSLPRDDEDLM